MNKGDLVKEGNVEDLTKSENIFIIHTVEPVDMELKRKILGVDENAGIGETEIHTETGIENVNRIVDLLRKNKIKLKSLQQKTSTLEELFINVINKDNVN